VKVASNIIKSDLLLEENDLHLNTAVWDNWYVYKPHIVILHATVLLAVKYTAELNKYILLVRVICEKYQLRGETNIPSRFNPR
jgi:hypothetical protein